jgi:hypothetical protein
MFKKINLKALFITLTALVFCAFCAQTLSAQSIQNKRDDKVVEKEGLENSIFQADRFVLCGTECQPSRYYVGYNYSNNATAKNESSLSTPRPDRVFRNIANLNQVLSLPFVDRRRKGMPNVEFADSRYEITANKIGFSKKSEEMTATSVASLSDIKATVKLFWGDTFRVTSNTLPFGAPVEIELQRTMGGSGDISALAFYDVNSETYLNGNKVVALNYKVARSPNGINVETGTGAASVIVTVRVGEIFNVESLLEVIDGIAAQNNSSQFLTGASDSVAHDVKLTTTSATQACLRSSSGTYSSGNCP